MKTYLFSFILNGVRQWKTVQGNDMEETLAENKTKNPDGRAFCIHSDQDCEEIRNSWKKFA